MAVLLGSQSNGRKEVLETAGIVFDTYNTSAEEIVLNGKVTKKDAVSLVIENSKIKMDSILKKNNIKNYNVVITADTVVWFNNKIYGKAKDKQEARHYLYDFAGKTHCCISGVTIVINRKHNKISRKELYDISKVMITSNKDLIEKYLENDEYKGKAGAYAIQGKGSILIDEITGNILNIMGLPLTLILEYLQKMNSLSLLRFK